MRAGREWRRCVLAGLLVSVLSVGAAQAQSPIQGVPRVLDGDTVEIGASRLRLFGIDAPETDQVCLDAQAKRTACGLTSRQGLERLAGRAWSCVVRDVDQYGRQVASCSAAGEDVGRAMVRQGLAIAFTRYSTAYVADEAAARQARAGLWAGAFVAPWDWRSRSKQTAILGAASVPRDAQKQLLAPDLPIASAPAASPSTAAGCVIKGNVNRSGECIYHQPGQRHYDQVKIGPGERMFCTTQRAEAAGCRASRI